jgi:hypothetical protein
MADVESRAGDETGGRVDDTSGKISDGAGDWLGAAHDAQPLSAPASASADVSALAPLAPLNAAEAAERDSGEWRVGAGDLSFAEPMPGEYAGFGSQLPPPASESALSLLNERIDRIEGLIAGELSVRLQDALAQVPTRDELKQALDEAVQTTTTEVVGKAVEPLVEAVSQLQSQHEEEMQKREEKHRADVEELLQRFHALGDEMARHNALTEEQITRLEEKRSRWKWPWNSGD